MSLINYLKDKLKSKIDLDIRCYQLYYEKIEAKLSTIDNDYFNLSKLEKNVRRIIYEIPKDIGKYKKISEEFLELKTEIHKKKISAKELSEKDGENILSLILK